MKYNYCQSLKDAFNKVKSIKKDANPNHGFMEQLCKIECEIFKKSMSETTIDIHTYKINLLKGVLLFFVSFNLFFL